MEEARSGLSDGADTQALLGGPELPPVEDEWLARGRYSAFGVSWAVEADDIAAYHLFLDRFPPGAAPTRSKTVARSYSFRTLPADAASDEASYLLLADGRPLLRSSRPGDIADAFEDNLKCVVAERCPRRAFVRAGVVGWKDRAIVIPGGSRTGKSTLVRTLVACGATYYSDEYAVLDGHSVYAYPSRTPEWLATDGKVRLSSLLKGTRNGQPGPLPVGIVVFAPYQPGASFKPQLLSRGKSLLGLFKHAVAKERRPEQALRILDMVTRQCHALEGVRGDAVGVARYLLDRLV